MERKISLLDYAEQILRDKKEPMDIYDLFDKIIKTLDIDSSEELMTTFYTNLTTSAKFLYAGDNEWDLKENQKIELWDKDGSHYEEYNEVKVPKKGEPKAAKKVKKAKPKPIPKAEPKDKKEEPLLKPQEEVKQPTIVDEKEKVEPQVDVVSDKYEDAEEEYEEEIFDDYDEFDEEKYNEYMDNYEDKYDE
ncbi:MAG: DNA-directed RNA polymerase subunit delta [Candidatus Izimaplasma sp.]|nr:DNA-directed RNA polymerase subunit delta [Candidatus Izimaplasma bacterium]